MHSQHRIRLLKELNGTDLGKEIQLMFDEEIAKLDTLTGIEDLKELKGRKECIKRLKALKADMINIPKMGVPKDFSQDNGGVFKIKQ